jgi:hypothetical protein
MTPKGDLKTWFLMLADAMGDPQQEVAEHKKKLAEWEAEHPEEAQKFNDMAEAQAVIARSETTNQSQTSEIAALPSVARNDSPAEEPLDPEIAAMVARQAAKGRIR